jgi:hypothetical protein
MLRKTPVFLRQSSDPQHPPREDLFRTQEDLRAGHHLIDTITCLELIFEALTARPELFKETLWQDGQIRNLEDVTLGAMLWTAAAQSALGKPWEPVPLAVGLWPSVFPLLHPDVLEQRIRSWVARVMAGSQCLAAVESYLNPLFMAYREEMMLPGFPEPPDPRLIRFFLFKGE